MKFWSNDKKGFPLYQYFMYRHWNIFWFTLTISQVSDDLIGSKPFLASVFFPRDIFLWPWHLIFENCHGHFFDVTGIFLRIVTGIFSMSRAKNVTGTKQKIILVRHFWTFKFWNVTGIFSQNSQNSSRAFFRCHGHFFQKCHGHQKKCHGEKKHCVWILVSIVNVSHQYFYGFLMIRGHPILRHPLHGLMF